MSEPPSRAEAVPPRAPLPYTLRVSPRAKRVTLRVLPGRGLVVTVPTRLAKRDVPAVVESHRHWVEATLAEQARRMPEACRDWPPRTLELAATGRRVSVAWSPAGGASRGAASSDRARWSSADTLVLPFAAGGSPDRDDPDGGDPEDRVRVAVAVADALRAEGRRVLVPRLARLAERHSLPFARVAVRGQRSVWGSCSSRGTVSLNWKLLFLRPALVDYVLVHELAHTRHLDHSPAFWRLLVSLEPAARALDAELRSAGRLVPPWLELARGR